MLFNIDRATKQDILQQYKQDALDYENRKKLERQRKIQEEREYLAQTQKREMELEDRLRYEKMRKQTEAMEDYKRMLQQEQNKPRFSKIGDVRVNNYGYNPNNSMRTYQTEPEQNYNNNINNQNNYNNSYQEPERQMSPSEKERSMIRREDHMRDFLTDRQNEREIQSYFQRQKENQQRYYKEFLDSQCKQRQQNQSMRNTPIMETRNVNIINQHKRFNLANDPYNKNRNIDFGASTLSHNPITNPTNNLDYNKYLNFNITPNSNPQTNTMTNSNPTMNINPYPKGQNTFNDNYYNPTPSNNQMNSIPPSNYNMTNNYNNPQSNNNYNPIPENNYNPMPQPSNNYNTMPSNNYNTPNYNMNNQQQMNQYQRGTHLPTPSGQTLRQAAASNFLK